MSNYECDDDTHEIGCQCPGLEPGTAVHPIYKDIQQQAKAAERTEKAIAEGQLVDLPIPRPNGVMTEEEWRKTFGPGRIMATNLEDEDELTKREMAVTQLEVKVQQLGKVIGDLTISFTHFSETLKEMLDNLAPMLNVNTEAKREDGENAEVDAVFEMPYCGNSQCLWNCEKCVSYLDQLP